MQYKLYENGNNDTSNVLAEVLKNRGIDDYNRYLNLDESVVEPYRNLDNIEEAVSLFMKHFNQKNKIGILVDEDPDGFCSAAMMYSYIKQMDSDYPVDYILHGRAKAHGLSDDVKILSDIDLLIIPDAGTNDKNEIKHINEDGIDILILDHHELEGKNKQEDLIFDDALNGTIYETVIVNNQMSNNYSNKNLCGAGVVYRFLQALDEENWNEFADDYLDLCALANISDVMDMRSFETRYFTDMGLLNIQNKCFKALVDAQDYSMGGKINIHNVQWYITPILNGSGLARQKKRNYYLGHLLNRMNSLNIRNVSLLKQFKKAYMTEQLGYVKMQKVGKTNKKKNVYLKLQRLHNIFHRKIKWL